MRSQKSYICVKPIMIVSEWLAKQGFPSKGSRDCGEEPLVRGELEVHEPEEEGTRSYVLNCKDLMKNNGFT